MSKKTSRQRRAAQSATQNTCGSSFISSAKWKCFFCSYFMVSVCCATCQPPPKNCASLTFWSHTPVCVYCFPAPVCVFHLPFSEHTCHTQSEIDGGAEVGPDAVLPRLPLLLPLPAADKCSCLGWRSRLGEGGKSDEGCGEWESLCRLFLNHPRDERNCSEVSSQNNCFLFFLLDYWTIERLRRGPLKRQQIKYVDGPDNNPEGIQVRNGNERKAFNGAVGPTVFEVRKKVNGGESRLAFSGNEKQGKKTLHLTFFVFEKEAKQLPTRPEDPNLEILPVLHGVT